MSRARTERSIMKDIMKTDKEIPNMEKHMKEKKKIMKTSDSQKETKKETQEKFREKWLKCERCGSRDIVARLGSQSTGNFNEKHSKIKPDRLCKRCGFIMSAIPREAR